MEDCQDRLDGMWDADDLHATSDSDTKGLHGLFQSGVPWRATEQGMQQLGAVYRAEPATWWKQVWADALPGQRTGQTEQQTHEEAVLWATRVLPADRALTAEEETSVYRGRFVAAYRDYVRYMSVEVHSNEEINSSAHRAYQVEFDSRRAAAKRSGSFELGQAVAVRWSEVLMSVTTSLKGASQSEQRQLYLDSIGSLTGVPPAVEAGQPEESPEARRQAMYYLMGRGRMSRDSDYQLYFQLAYAIMSSDRHRLDQHRLDGDLQRRPAGAEKTPEEEWHRLSLVASNYEFQMRELKTVTMEQLLTRYSVIYDSSYTDMAGQHARTVQFDRDTPRSSILRTLRSAVLKRGWGVGHCTTPAGAGVSVALGERTRSPSTSPQPCSSQS
jgi:hypothetical protein